MSTQPRHDNTSLNNQPERDASKLAASEATDILGKNQSTQSAIPTDTNNTSTQEKAPVDRHGDTWGGGIPGHNSEFK